MFFNNIFAKTLKNSDLTITDNKHMSLLTLLHKSVV